MKETIIQTTDLVKIYQMGDMQVKALDGITLQIQSGEFVAIMGPSGSGKSTLMNILGCLDRPTSGGYYLGQEDVSKLDRTELALIRNQRIGFVFQSYNLLSKANALQNVLLPLIYSRNGNGKLSKEARQQKAMDTLKLVGLEDRAHHLPTEMSGGQQQRVAIARALVNDPIIILADEPTGNLDSHSGIEIMEILTELNKHGHTIIMVTHSKETALFAQRTVIFRDGHVEQDNLHSTQNKESAL